MDTEHEPLKKEPICKVVEIHGKKLYHHKVFGIVDGDWFRSRGLLPSSTGYPVVQVENKWVPDPKFLEAEEIDRHARSGRFI